MALLKARKKKDRSLDNTVNITSLMDVMTVLLFFLIKSFTVSSTTLTPPEGVRLPASTVEVPPEETVMVSISDREIRGDNHVLMTYSGGKFTAKDVGPDRLTLMPLQSFLAKQAKKRMAVYEGAGDTSLLPPGKLLIQADKALPFGTLKHVLHTATTAGYADYQFVVTARDVQ